MNRFLEIIEEVTDTPIIDEDEVLDPFLMDAEDLRNDLIDNLADLGFKEAEINSGSVDRKAYWSWTFAIESDNQCLECTIILYLDAENDCSRYSVEVINQGGRAWATANNTSTDRAANEAFDELKRLFALIAQETV